MTTTTTPAAYVPSVPTLQAVRTLSATLAKADKVYGAVGAAALETLKTTGHVTPEGTLSTDPTLPSLRTVAKVTTPRTGQPKGTTWVLPSGDARVAAINAGGHYAAWILRVEAVRQSLQRAADKVPGAPAKVKRAAKDKGAQKPETVVLQPTAEAVADAAESMLASLAAGKRAKGITPERAKTIKALAATIAPAAPAAPAAPVLPTVSQPMAAQAIAGWLKAQTPITPELLKVCEAVVMESHRARAARDAAIAKADAKAAAK